MSSWSEVQEAISQIYQIRDFVVKRLHDYPDTVTESKELSSNITIMGLDYLSKDLISLSRVVEIDIEHAIDRLEKSVKYLPIPPEAISVIERAQDLVNFHDDNLPFTEVRLEEYIEHLSLALKRYKDGS